MFDAHRVWLYAPILTVGYMSSRGLAKGQQPRALRRLASSLGARKRSRPGSVTAERPSPAVGAGGCVPLVLKVDAGSVARRPRRAVWPTETFLHITDGVMRCDLR